MSLDSAGLFTAVLDHAQTLGIFDRVGTHEPKNAPGNGLTCAVWLGPIAPAAAASGLAIGSGRVEFLVRVYNPMLQAPQDDIDPTVLTAVDALFAAYAGDFDLGGRIRNVDIFGQHGKSLSAQPGYLNQDSKLFRVMDVTLPLIINDLWNEVA